MRVYPRYLPRYPISNMKNLHPIRSRYPIFWTLVAKRFRDDASFLNSIWGCHVTIVHDDISLRFIAMILYNVNYRMPWHIYLFFFTIFGCSFFLMEYIVSCLLHRPSNWRKKRIHFHDFMLNMHSRLQVFLWFVFWYFNLLKCVRLKVATYFSSHLLIHACAPITWCL